MSILPVVCWWLKSTLKVVTFLAIHHTNMTKKNLPDESYLEETYYHELNPEQGFVFQRVYTEDGSIDETMTIEHQNVVEVPKGYHPVGVPDGYTSYYLNVMAGPERIWKFHNEKNTSGF